MGALSGSHIMVVAAGTGGHVLPGIEFGHAFEAEGARVTYVCGSRPAESRIYAAAGLSPRVIAWPGSAPTLSAKARRAALLAMAPPRAARLVASLRPDAVLSMGGGFSAPVLCAAKLLDIPLFLHDSNSVVGRVTRWFAPLAKRTFLGLPVMEPLPRPALVGTPVRPMPQRAPSAAPSIVVMGGSQGARRLNECAFEAAAAVVAEFPGASVTVLGVKPADRPAALPAGVEALEYVDNPGALLARAWVAVTRSGAGTLAELAALGVPAVLVPYPHAMDDHQTANAQAAVAAGGAVLLREAGLGGSALAQEVLALLRDPERRAAMGRGVATLHRAESRAAVAATIAAELRGRTQRTHRSSTTGTPPILPKGSPSA
jgi:UDP-N-acetylglucosamine--N-acetylmuramyl-(pentapeptide) pyrophosphoryl-undecaprenol N-acetylglucosamine transferase